MNSSVPGPRSSEASAPAMMASIFGTSAPNSYTSAAIGISGATPIAMTGTSTADIHPEASARAPKDKHSGKYRMIIRGFSWYIKLRCSSCDDNDPHFDWWSPSWGIRNGNYTNSAADL